MRGRRQRRGRKRKRQTIFSLITWSHLITGFLTLDLWVLSDCPTLCPSHAANKPDSLPLSAAISQSFTMFWSPYRLCPQTVPCEQTDPLRHVAIQRNGSSYFSKPTKSWEQWTWSWTNSTRNLFTPLESVQLLTKSKKRHAYFFMMVSGIFDISTAIMKSTVWSVNPEQPCHWATELSLI